MFVTEVAQWARDRANEPPRSILTHDAWLEFNRQRWGVTPERVRLSEGADGGPAIETVYYLNARGKIWRPPLIPYTPVIFSPTPTRHRDRLDRQWLAVGRLLAEDMQRRGVVNTQFMAPGLTDLRPWQWTGFQVGVRYTFRIDLPHSPDQFSSTVRRDINRARKAGYTVERTVDLHQVRALLAESEERQNFQYGLPLEALFLAREVMGDDLFRCYICYAPNGEPAAAEIVLVKRGGEALGWVIGTANDHLRSGATQLLDADLIAALAADGVTCYDFLGANLPTVAAAKVTWGATLVPYYTIDAPGLWGLARHARDLWRYTRRQNAWPSRPVGTVHAVARPRA